MIGDEVDPQVFGMSREDDRLVVTVAGLVDDARFRAL